MRIGIDASNIRAGGGITHLSEILTAFRAENSQIDKIVVWASHQTLAKLPNHDPHITLSHQPQLDGSLPARLLWRFVQMPKLVESSCDLLFAPGGTTMAASKPMVTMSRNMLPFEMQELRRYGFSSTALRLLILRYGQARGFSKADGVIFLTDYAQKAVTHQLKNFNGKSTVIPHGVSRRFAQTPRKQRPLTDYSRERPFRLLYISIVDVYKHQWTVAEAISQLHQQGFPITLDLVGPAYPPALKHLQKSLETIENSQTFIHYHGAKPYSQLEEFYHRADGFVFASSCENMPNILLEAMIAGLPIAASNRGPMPEILSDAGFYFDPEQKESITNAIKSLLADSTNRENHASLSFKQAQRYDWQRCANETFEFLTNVGL